MSDVGRILDELAPLFEEEPRAASLPADPEAARIAARLFYVDGLLREACGRKARVRRRGLLWGIGSGLAAAAALAVVAWLVGPEEVARIERAQGASLGGREVRAGDPIPARGELRVVGSAAVVLPDATRIGLGSGARVTFDSAKRISIAGGTVEARVSPQPAGEPLAFSTPNGEARILGTVLRLSVRGSSTVLEVEEGKVRFTRSDAAVADVTGGQYVVAATGQDLSPRRLTRGVSFAAQMEPDSWLAVPDTLMRRVAVTRKEVPTVWASTQGPAAMFTRSGGGALDTRRNRLYVWGGGFTHYHGNEMYSFDLESLTWERLTEPYPQPSLNQERNPDGSPVSRDVFGGFTYVTHADRIFACGGILAGAGAERARTPWMFDPAAKKWQALAPSGAAPPTGAYNTAVYDPRSRKVWWGDGQSGENGPGLYSYDVDANSWTKHDGTNLSHYGAALDTRRHQLVFAGEGRVVAYDLSAPQPKRTAWPTTGGDEFLRGEHVGFDYDPVSDRLVGWAGGPVYLLDPQRKVWSVHEPPGAPPPKTRSVLGRWRYVPTLGVFVAAFAIDDNVYFYKPPQ